MDYSKPKLKDANAVLSALQEASKGIEKFEDVIKCTALNLGKMLAQAPNNGIKADPSELHDFAMIFINLGYLAEKEDADRERKEKRRGSTHHKKRPT